MKKYPCVLQTGIKDCGASSLLTIIKSYNGNIPHEYLRMITNTTRDGVTAFSLLEAGRKLGFDTKGVAGNVFDIENRFLPCIAHVVVDEKYKHFVVIHEINKKNKTLIIADPAKGLIKMKMEDFIKISTTNFLLFTPIKKIPFISSENEIKNDVLRILYGNKKELITIVLFSILYTLLNIITSFNFQFIIERALAYNSKTNLYFIFLIMLILFVFKDIVEYLRNSLLNFINHKLDYILINNSFSHILLLPHLYYKNRTTGEVISRINDLGEIKNSISHLIMTFLVDFILIIFVLFFLFSISSTLTFIMLAFICFYSLITYLFNRYLYGKIRIIKENEGMFNSYMVELISGVETVRGTNTFGRVLDKFSSEYNRYLTSSYDFISITNMQKGLCNCLISIMTITLVFSGSLLVMEESLSIGSLITYNSLIYYFLEPIKNIINFDLLFKRIKIVADRINELLNIKSEEIFFDFKNIDDVIGNIEIKKLSYSYNGKDYLLKNINLLINSGEKVVICGKSGCGKSTLARIIASYIPISRNHILIDGKDIVDYNLWTLRENITYVSQNEFLFTDTIYNNINIDDTRDYNSVLNVCKCMSIDEIVKNSTSGYNMLLEENGANISGGEKQRIVLARTFLKESSIYILDESFSEIDSEKERSIIKRIFKKYKEKTIIVISHRYDNNDLYDRVINMENLTYGA